MIYRMQGTRTALGQNPLPSGGSQAATVQHVVEHRRAIQEERARAEIGALIQRADPNLAAPIRGALAAFETAFPAARFRYTGPQTGYRLDPYYWPASRIMAVAQLTGSTLMQSASILRTRGLNAPGEVDLGGAAQNLPASGRPLEPSMPVYALFQSAEDLMASLPADLNTLQGAAWIRSFGQTFKPMLGTATTTPGPTPLPTGKGRGQNGRADYQDPDAGGSPDKKWVIAGAGILVVATAAYFFLRKR